MNLVPTGDYESEEEDEEGDILQPEEIDTNLDVDNLFKALEDASQGVEITDERISQFISTMDQDYSTSLDNDVACSVDGNPRTSTAQRITESLRSQSQEVKQLVFGSIYRKPRPLLSPSARRSFMFLFFRDNW